MKKIFLAAACSYCLVLTGCTASSPESVVGAEDDSTLSAEGQAMEKGAPVKKDVPVYDYEDFPVLGEFTKELSTRDPNGDPELAFKVFKAGASLVYRKENCVLEDRGAVFIAHYYPLNQESLGDSGKLFVNRDFSPRAFYMDGSTCYISAALPDFEVSFLRTGQWDPVSGTRWNVVIDGAELD